MRKKRWLILTIFVVAVAAVGVGAYLWFGRNKPATVHYLTSKASKGTISQTVSADFTLDSATGATSVALGGGAASSSSSSSSSSNSSTGTASTSSLQTSPGSASGVTLALDRSSDGATAPTFAVLSAATPATRLQASVALPTVTGVSPSSGSTAGGISVTVTGTGFSTSAPTVKFGAYVATSVSVDSDTSLTCTSPAGSAGTVDVTVATTAGSSATSAADRFTYQTPASPTATATPTPTPTKTSYPTPSSSTAGSSSSGSSGTSGSFSRSASSSSSGSSTTTTSSSTSSSSTFSGVVTRLARPAGATPATLQRLLYVSGKPVFAFVSPTPLWKNLSTSLSSGVQRTNVAALQKALKKKGYYKKAINGDFTSATKTAFKHWQKANGLSQTGVLNVTRFVWMPTGSVLTSWSVGLGSHVSSGTALASVVSPSRLSATASISQADIAELKVGQKAQMVIDGYTSDSFTGRISFISNEPVSSSSASGSSSSTQYSITISPRDLPSLAKSGMTGTLTIVLAQRTNVLLVPTSAVSGTSSTSYVRVMQNGQPVFRQVQTGMSTSSYTQITSGLAEGETVVTGQYTNGATSTSTSSSSSSGGLFRRSSSGGGFPSGGFPGGGFPGGGGQ